jgi:hypothetical protein
VQRRSQELPAKYQILPISRVFFAHEWAEECRQERLRRETARFKFAGADSQQLSSRS